jgi:hypothetical protein
MKVFTIFGKKNTDVVSKADGMNFEMSDLQNGKTSAYYATADTSTVRGDDYITKAANGGSPYSLNAPPLPRESFRVVTDKNESVSS